MSVQPDTDHRTDEPGLFADLPAPSPELVAQAQARELAKRGAGAVRLLQPNRLQVELRASNLESLLPEDHRARLVWGYVELQDLSRLVEAVKARGSNAGRAAIDPRVLFALWLYATLEGVGSGREVARLTAAHDAYRWICGGVSVNHHALNDFRSSNDALMDELLTTNVAALAAAGAISLERVAQDGMRVRADAGAASFRRQASLDEHLNEAGELVRTLKAQAKADPGEGQRREQAARLRGAQEREARIKAALAQLPEVAATKKRNGGKAEEARASTTDPDAAGIADEELLLIASGGDVGALSAAKLMSRRPFSGHWEYHIEGALFTAPARRDHSGAGLFNQQGELVGIGSLFVADAMGPAEGRLPGNMFVPIDLLKPILSELKTRGASIQSTRAWIGVNCVEQGGLVRVVRVSEDSPADDAGVAVGDQIVRIDGVEVQRLETLWKTLWRGAAAERAVVLEIVRQGKPMTLTVQTVDRSATLRRPKGI